MRIRLILALGLMLPVMAVAQIEVVGGARLHPQPAAATNIAPRFSLPGGFTPPEGLFDEFWADPAIAGELHLSDAQRKQLQDAALTQRLSLIDSGAESFKAFLKLSAILDAEPFNDAAYKKQLDELAVSAGKAVQNVGEMVAAPRRILTSEQWAKLQKLKKVKQTAAKPTSQSKIPPSLQQPIQR